MEEADARLQEVLASLLNEHEGNHEPALRQTFACLHNSGLYEAQSDAEEEQREQQVLAIFHSFPFRAPAAPVDDGAGSLVEETQAPPAYSAIVREPEEAGEVTGPPAAPEHVGEDAAAQPAPEAQLPQNPGLPQEEEGTSAGGPELGHQAGPLPVPQAHAEAPLQEPVAGADGGSEEGAAAGSYANGGVEETKDNEDARGDHPESGEVQLGEIEPRARAEAATDGEGGRAVGENGGRSIAANGNVPEGAAVGSQEGTRGGLNGNDPESSRQDLQEEPPRAHSPAAESSQLRSEELQEPHHQLNGLGTVHPASATPTPKTASSASVARREQNGMDAAGAAGAASAPKPSPQSTASAVAAAAAPSTSGGWTSPAVTEPHLKTGGQPLTHANRAESPTGLSTDLQDKLKQLKIRRKHRFVVMRIDGTQVVADRVGDPGAGPSDLRVALPYSDCRYAVYDQEILTADGRKANKLFFFTWLPHNATPHNKMAYSHGKVTVRQRMEGLYDVAASSFSDVEVALGLVDEDEEDSDIDF